MVDHDWSLHETDGTVCRACGCGLAGNAASSCRGPTAHARRLLGDIEALKAVAFELARRFSGVMFIKYDVDLAWTLAGLHTRPRETKAALEQALAGFHYGRPTCCGQDVGPAIDAGEAPALGGLAKLRVNDRVEATVVGSVEEIGEDEEEGEVLVMFDPEKPGLWLPIEDVRRVEGRGT